MPGKMRNRVAPTAAVLLAGMVSGCVQPGGGSHGGLPNFPGSRFNFGYSPSDDAPAPLAPKPAASAHAAPKPAAEPPPPAPAPAPEPARALIPSLDSALACMDVLLLAHDKHDIRVTTEGVANATGEPELGSKEILTNALAAMSRRSHAFTVLDDVPALVATASSGVLPDHPPPQYYFRGAVATLKGDEIPPSSTWAIPKAGGALEWAVRVGLNVASVATRRVVPRSGAEATMAVAHGGSAGDDFARIGTGALTVDVSMREVSDQLKPALELAAVEAVGRFTETPFWKCFPGTENAAAIRAVGRSWYDAMSPDERRLFVLRKLVAEGLDEAAVGRGETDPVVVEKVSAYRREKGLDPEGGIGFDLYAAMLNDDTPLATLTNAPPAAAAPAALAPAKVPIKLGTGKGDTPVYGVGEEITANAQVQGGAFVYCFLGGSDGKLSRIFPNRFEPDPYVTSGALVIAASQSPLKIPTDTPGRLRLTCLAGTVDPVLPNEFRTPDLAPIASLASVEQAQTLFKVRDPQVSQDTLEITVE